MEKQQLELAKVESVDLFIEDHGILTLFVNLDYGGTHQGFGGYSLDGYDETLKRRVGTAGGTDFILRILNMFKVSKLEDIKGRSVYAIKQGEKYSSTVIGLKTPDFDGGEEFLISDWRRQWFPLEEIEN
jgi:hypothetical protein